MEKLDYGRMVWTFELWTTGRLNCGRLDTSALDTWNLSDWTLGPWTRGLWVLGPWNFFSIFSDICFFFILLNAEFLNILKPLGPMYYGSVERMAYGCYNSNLLHSLARQQLGLKRNCSWKGAQITGSETIQIGHEIFQK